MTEEQRSALRSGNRNLAAELVAKHLRPRAPMTPKQLELFWRQRRAWGDPIRRQRAIESVWETTQRARDGQNR